MRKYFILILLLAFVWCGSWEEEENQLPTWLSHYDGSWFSIDIPENWEILKSESGVLPQPKSSKIELAASSDNIKSGFSSNILILSQVLNKPITSLDFSISNNIGASKEYLEYLKLDSRSVEFVDGGTSNLYIFEAKYNLTTPRLKYIQTGRVCGGRYGYLITIAIPMDVKDTSLYEAVIKRFSCKL